MNELTSHPQDLVYALAASPNFRADGICFAARTSGLYVSRDGGSNWESAYASLGLPAALMTTAVALSPGFGTSDQLVIAGTHGGFLRSQDGGQTWSSTELPPPPPLISCLALSPGLSQDGIAFAGSTNDGIFLSTDQGITWDSWNFGLLDLNVLCLVLSPSFEQDKTLFVGTESGLYVSRNGGRSWREPAFPQEARPVLSLAISPSFASDGILFAGTEGHGVFVSHDSGKTWNGLAEHAPEPINVLLIGSDFATTHQLLRLSGTTIQFSLDAGATWQNLDVDSLENQVVTCIAAPNGLGEGTPLLLGIANTMN